MAGTRTPSPQKFLICWRWPDRSTDDPSWWRQQSSFLNHGWCISQDSHPAFKIKAISLEVHEVPQWFQIRFSSNHYVWFITPCFYPVDSSIKCFSYFWIFFLSKQAVSLNSLQSLPKTRLAGGPRVNATVFLSSILSQIQKAKEQRFHTVVGLPKRLIFNVEHI